jgi:hypothetical protein
LVSGTQNLRRPNVIPIGVEGERTDPSESAASHLGTLPTPLSYVIGMAFGGLKLSPQMGFTHRDHIDKIESLLYRTADIHGMEPFGLILAPQPYKKLERIVSIIHTPMVSVWFLVM